ncbi:LysR family transcriptional regulator [Defluviimonas sp. D31]|uniref:LysR family transcriptional regulator n=1 Tax=Defluviimonas sp. D31 TaxID=3083253 RepID=UPI00296FA338|nr:LysR family transcriptional regulator [Defluviimonas sp. D31]MDW4550906.1 LysR family transcriptional regulator [Defluviimonas sp. D31]
MDRPPPPLNYIRSFECAARHLSFTKAAEELGYTQAAISTHIRALEKYVGRDLFVRGTRSIALTEIGEAFLPTLRQALHQIDTATDAIATTSRDRSVIVACPMSLAENWLPACLAGFRSRNPEVEIVVNATIWDHPDDVIADISISVNRNDEVPPGASLLWDETLSLVCSPYAGEDIADGMSVESQAKIVVAGRQEYWGLFGYTLGNPDMDLDGAIRTNATNVALELSANGLGATIALTSLCGTYIERGLLMEPLQVRPKSPWSYYIKMPQGRRSNVAKRLFDYISEYAGEEGL